MERCVEYRAHEGQSAGAQGTQRKGGSQSLSKRAKVGLELEAGKAKARIKDRA